jgi:hypothetical protein
LLTNTAPEDALTRAMAVLSQRPDPLLPADKVNPAIPRGVAGVLQKAMDLNASARPATATEMRQMLRDHEKYSYLADDVTVALPAGQVPLAAQPTRLMPEETRPAAALAGGFPVSTHADDASQLTSLRPGLIDQTAFAPAFTTEAPPAPKRGFAVAAGILVVLVIGAAAAGGVYLVKPSLFGGREGGSTAEVPAATADPAVLGGADQNDVATDGMPINTAPAGEQAGTGIAPEADRPAGIQSEQVHTSPAQTGTRTIKPGNDRSPQDDVTELTFDEEDSDLPSDTTITTRDESGRVTTVKVKPGRTRLPAAEPGDETYPSPRDFDWNRMTPEQRRRFQEKIFRQVVRPNLPAPPPRPDN